MPRPKGTKSVSEGFKLVDRWEGERIADLQEVCSWKDEDRAAICGVGGLLVFDFDSQESYEKFWDVKIASRLHNDTFTVKTFRGFQNWFIDRSFDPIEYKSTIDAKPKLDLEIFISHHLAACPGNTHPTGCIYELMGTGKIWEKDGALVHVLERLKSLGICQEAKRLVIGDAGNYSTERSPHIPTEIEKERIVKAIATKWRVGYRNAIVLELSGFLIREQWSESDALSIFEKILDAVGDKSAKSSVFSKVKYQYRTKDRHPLASPRIIFGKS